jgi:hypothetical protein
MLRASNRTDATIKIEATKKKYTFLLPCLKPPLTLLIIFVLERTMNENNYKICLLEKKVF